MQINRSRLVQAFVFTVLFLLAFVGITVIGGFVLGRAASLRPLRTGAMVAGGLAALIFLISAGAIAINAALQPSSWGRKFLFVLPAYFLGFTLTGVILFLAGIGTVGPFLVIWLAAGSLLTIITTCVAIGRMKLSTGALRLALNGLSITSILSVIAWAAMVIAIGMVLLNPTLVRAGNRNRPENATAAGAATTTAAQPRQGGGEQRRPGGPGGSTTPLAIGGGLLTVFLALELFGVTRARRGPTALAADTNAAPLTLSPAHYGGETGRAILSCLAITVVAWGIGQLIPVAHTNPPVQTAIQWDSPQTQTLAKRDCMDCHSNETVWPAYSYIAPGSWLTVLHVNDGRGELNFSELNNLPAFRKANLAESVAEEIRSGAMPPKDYLYIHADAKLTDAEKTQLIEGFQKSLAQSLSK